MGRQLTSAVSQTVKTRPEIGGVESVTRATDTRNSLRLI